MKDKQPREGDLKDVHTLLLDDKFLLFPFDDFSWLSGKSA